MNNSLQTYSSLSSMVYSDNSSVTLNGLEGQETLVVKKPRKKREPKYDENGNIIPRKRRSKKNTSENTTLNVNMERITQNNVISIHPNNPNNINLSSTPNNFPTNSLNMNKNNINSIISQFPYNSNRNNTPSWNNPMLHLLDNKNYLVNNNIINNSKNPTTISPQTLGNSIQTSKNLSYGYSNQNPILPNNILHNRNPETSNPYLNQSVNNNSGMKPIYPLFPSNPIVHQLANQQSQHQQSSQPSINPKLINNMSIAGSPPYSKLIPKSNIYQNNVQNSNYDTSKKDVMNNENKNISNYSQPNKVISNSQNYMNPMTNKVNTYSNIEDRSTIQPSILINNNNNNNTITITTINNNKYICIYKYIYVYIFITLQNNRKLLDFSLPNQPIKFH